MIKSNKRNYAFTILWVKVGERFKGKNTREQLWLFEGRYERKNTTINWIIPISKCLVSLYS